VNKLLFIGAIVLSFTTQAQTPLSKNPDGSSKPKLVVGVIVDQMRNEYLFRFQEKYGEGGFKRLMREGFTAKNHHYHYANTVTGPGHAHVYTGSVPAVTGIVGNEWFDKATARGVYVAEDSAVTTVGGGSAKAGKMSPVNLKTTGVADQLRIATQFGAKVIGVAIKDRGAILPASHTGTAYWFDSSVGNWITSSYYMNELPDWLKAFNAKKVAESYTKQTWNTLNDIKLYTASEEDDQPYENTISGESKAVFPHAIKMNSLASTPWGNTLTLDVALEALKHEQLGKDDITDLLAISFSSPDYVGHAFGPQSKELEDVYIRLDKEIERLLNALDSQVGKGKYTVFVTADHAVAEIPAYLRKHNIPSGLFVGTEFQRKAVKTLMDELGEGNWIMSMDNYQIYLNRDLLKEKGVSVDQVFEILYASFVKEEGVYQLVNLEKGNVSAIPPFYQGMLQNVYNPKRSGELMILVEPGWFHGYTKGTTHGTMWAYDTHVPMLWFGNGVPQGSTVRRTHISDIAPTLSSMLDILEPNGSVGEPIIELFK
jgi:hypothetical protein